MAVLVDLCPNCGWRFEGEVADCPLCGWHRKEPEQDDNSAWPGFVTVVLGIPYVFLGGALLFWGPDNMPWFERIMAFAAGMLVLKGLLLLGPPCAALAQRITRSKLPR